MFIKARKKLLIIALLNAFYASSALADQNVVNNYSSSAPPTTQPCNNNNADNSSKNDVPPGMQIIQNGDGSTSRVFSTGTKKPYIVDNGCNNTPIIQPYISPTIPYGPPRPGPRGGK